MNKNKKEKPEIKFVDKDYKIIVNGEPMIFPKIVYERSKARYIKMLKKGVSNGK